MNVDAVDGVVSLRGQLGDRDVIRDLVAAVGEVSGVRQVDNLLHTPHTTAPNVKGLQQPGGLTSPWPIPKPGTAGELLGPSRGAGPTDNCEGAS